MVDVDVDKCWFPKDDKDCSNLAVPRFANPVTLPAPKWGSLPQRMKVKSEFLEVTSRHCIFQNLGCVVQERKRKKEVGLRENAEGTKGKILGILFLGCGLSYVISKAWSVEGWGTLFCSHLKWSTCRINFQHPLVSSSACWSLHITLASMCIVPSYRNTWRTSLCLCKRIFSTKKQDGLLHFYQNRVWSPVLCQALNWLTPVVETLMWMWLWQLLILSLVMCDVDGAWWQFVGRLMAIFCFGSWP